MGWTDPSILNCGRFYPPWTRTSLDRLQFYSRTGGFGSVEVDSSTYTILNPEHVEKWIAVTPKSFVFHFKAYGLLCDQLTDYLQLPSTIKQKINFTDEKVRINYLHENIKKEIWRLFENSVEPAYVAGKLGCIVFQFQNSFAPSFESKRYVEYCCTELHEKFRIAIDFRNRGWIDKAHLENTIHWLRGLRRDGVALVHSLVFNCLICASYVLLNR